MKLKRDINSVFRRKTYGVKGETVTPISRSGDVLIVEGANGRFPLTLEDVEDFDPNKLAPSDGGVFITSNNHSNGQH